ncbi:hypothetical protein B0H19DRAFT_1349663 [Mycena capillaripes]|nr:hypothetical protein B0H19DRAFT_1349663 [Mycena capillaripes]
MSRKCCAIILFAVVAFFFRPRCWSTFCGLTPKRSWVTSFEFWMGDKVWPLARSSKRYGMLSYRWLIGARCGNGLRPSPHTHRARRRHGIVLPRPAGDEPPARPTPALSEADISTVVGELFRLLLRRFFVGNFYIRSDVLPEKLLMKNIGATLLDMLRDCEVLGRVFGFPPGLLSRDVTVQCGGNGGCTADCGVV